MSKKIPLQLLKLFIYKSILMKLDTEKNQKNQTCLYKFDSIHKLRNIMEKKGCNLHHKYLVDINNQS